MGAPDRRRRGPRRSADRRAAAHPRPRRAALRRHGGRSERARADRPARRDRLAARRDRVAVPDVHGRARPRPQRLRQGSQPGHHVRPHDVHRPVRAGVRTGRDDRLRARRRRPPGLCLRVAHARHVSVDPQLRPGHQPGCGDHGRRDGDHGHAGADRPRRRVGPGLGRRQRGGAHLAGHDRAGHPRGHLFRRPAMDWSGVLRHDRARPSRPLHLRRRRPAHRFGRRVGRRHRTDRRRLLRRPRHQPAGAERERDHGAHRVLRLGAA